MIKALLAITVLLLSLKSFANPFVGRALPGEDPTCGDILYLPNSFQTDEFKAPNEIEVFYDGDTLNLEWEKVVFKFVARSSSENRNIFLYESKDEANLELVDKCPAEGTDYKCFIYNQCRFHANFWN